MTKVTTPPTGGVHAVLTSGFLRPGIVIPAVLSVGLIAALLSVSDPTEVVTLMSRFQHSYLLYFLLVIMVYEGIRGAQWHFLLRSLGVRAPLQAEAFSFLLGEVTKAVPVGNYFQSYLLSRVESEDFGETSATSTLIILTEVAVSLAGIVLIGVDGWSWLRPVILIGLGVFALVALAGSRAHHPSSLPDWLGRAQALRAAAREAQRFRHGVRRLLTPRVIAVESSLSATYLLTAGGALYLVVLGLGIGNLSIWQVLGVYFFSLAVGLIAPLPTDIGLIEVSGVGALVALGVSRNSAVGVMLVNRALSIGAALVIALIALVFLRDELRLALRPPRQGGSEPG